MRVSVHQTSPLWGRTSRICISKLGHHLFIWWLVAWSAPSHYRKQWWNFVDWARRNKHQWNFNRNSYNFITDNTFEDVRIISAILSRPQFLNPAAWRSIRHFSDVACMCYWYFVLTHWGRVARISVSKLTIIGSDNVLAPGRRQVIIGTSDGILFIGLLGTNFSEISIEIYTSSFKKIHFKMSSDTLRAFWLGLSLTLHPLIVSNVYYKSIGSD